MPTPRPPDSADEARGVLVRNNLAIAITEPNPVSPGHTLIVPVRSVTGWFEATQEERHALTDLVGAVKELLDRGVLLQDGTRAVPAGYNVGFDVGEASGQRPAELQLHVIPRYEGDAAGDRGGLRHVIPAPNSERGSRIAPLTVGGRADPFLARVHASFALATNVRIVAAFVQHSGLEVLTDAITAALSRGSTVRILTGDYLDITQASALRRLLGWQNSDRAARTDEDRGRGLFEARVVETRAGRWKGHSFHPKAWIFEAGARSVAFVGSSNISRSALQAGVEWNLGVEVSHDAATFERLRTEFEELWRSAAPLTATWVEAYAKRARDEQRSLPKGEVEDEPLPTLPEPRDVQLEALERLRSAREAGQREALVVLATGLGKTLLAILDFAAVSQASEGPTRLLYVAHRQEILEQAAEQVRRFAEATARELHFGWCMGDEGDLDADVVFASISKLSRPATIARLRGQRFHYVVIDEVHHAAADSYQRVLDAIEYDFLLGLTATPERADEQEYLQSFGGRVTYRADIGKGIELGHLVPFEYFGVRDEIDYEHIPWRNRRFDPTELARAAQTEARMQTMLRAWRAHPGRRTLVFCCSVEHARFVADRLKADGQRVQVVYAAKGSDDRAGALRALRSGEIDAICAVDVFNEGVDVREIDRVILLRPTESKVVFLQQLGRGLRVHDGKQRLVVIDFVGNHALFADRLRALFSLGAERDPAAALRSFIDAGTAPTLPAGCSVELELEAKAVLERFVKPRSTESLLSAYDELRDRLGRRPTAGELMRAGYNPASLRSSYASWFAFVEAKGDLQEEERSVHESWSALLEAIERVPAGGVESFVALEAIVNLEGLGADGVAMDGLLAESWRIVERRGDYLGAVEPASRPNGTPEAWARFARFWQEKALESWLTARRGSESHFEVRGDRLLSRRTASTSDRDQLGAMIRELVSYRLFAWRRRNEALIDGFRGRVGRSRSGEPVLLLPDGTGADGTRDVRLPTGDVWVFDFQRKGCNFARSSDGPRNRLPDLLRDWFGPDAGASDKECFVRFYASPDGLWVEPDTVTRLADTRARGRVISYPDLRAAAGHAQATTPNLEADEVVLPTDRVGPELFAVRVAGNSMEGGDSPMREGDWALLRLARAATAAELAGRVVLSETPDGTDGFAYQLKRLMRAGAGWELRSDNPSGPRFEAHEPMKVIARLEASIRPEELGPPAGALLAESELAEAFSIGELIPRSGRHGGHLFLFLTELGQMRAPTDVVAPELRYRPAETAFVLARRSDGRWKYVGVGRRAVDAPGEAFTVPEVDHATWRAVGDGGRGASRVLATDALSFAERIVDAVLMEEPRPELIRADGRRAVVVGRAKGGGLMIEGPPGGFARRTVTLTDFGWVVMAVRDLLDHGGELDEARVNRVRYLEGTPKASTRWIDLGWALAAYARVRESVGLLRREESGPLRVRDAGEEIDATYSRVREGQASWIYFEAGGGSAGSSGTYNTQYTLGLELLLGQLKAAGNTIEEIVVDSRRTRELSDEDRRITLRGYSYPITIDDPAAVRRAIAEGQRHIAREPGAKGPGNSNRRLRIRIAAKRS